MSLETSLSNITVKNNVFSDGKSSNGGSLTSHTFDQHAWISGSSNITGNVFSGPAASADMLNIDNCSCIITNNKFIRGSTSINSYIKCLGSNDQNITNNVFDKSTTNGTSEQLVNSITGSSHYESNKNQSALTEVALSSDALLYSHTNNQPTLFGAYTSAVYDVYFSEISTINNSTNPNGDFLQIEDTGVGAATRSLLKRFNLSSLVPRGAKIISAQAGVGLASSNNFSSGFFTIRLTSFKKIATQGTTGTILDVTDNRTNPSNYVQQDGYATLDLMTLVGVTSYLTLDTTNYLSSDVSENYRIGGEYNTVLEWKYSYTKSDTVAPIFSPIVIKYIW